MSYIFLAIDFSQCYNITNTRCMLYVRFEQPTIFIVPKPRCCPSSKDINIEPQNGSEFMNTVHASQFPNDLAFMCTPGGTQLCVIINQNCPCTFDLPATRHYIHYFPCLTGQRTEQNKRKSMSAKKKSAWIGLLRTV